MPKYYKILSLKSPQINRMWHSHSVWQLSHLTAKCPLLEETLSIHENFLSLSVTHRNEHIQR